MIPLECPVQQYAWGKLGEASAVAQLAQAGAGLAVDAAAPYAELWVGTHVNGPALAVVGEAQGGGEGGKRPLSEHLRAHPELVATSPEARAAYSDGGLPFLFKILSVGKALSIQAHPDKALAERLHAERPEVYKDPNHKPEMACAVTEFEALCGFLGIGEIERHLRATPELEALLRLSAEAKQVLAREGCSLSYTKGDEASEKEVLRILFSALMTSDAAAVLAHVTALQARLAAAAAAAADADALSKEDALALRLTGQYPGDVGVFCAYFMCYRRLQPGQACFLGANEPHAYLSGDCAEIMATSDNVVRAGLTPKLRDVGTLCDMLTYRQPSHAGAEFHPGNLLEGQAREGGKSVVYAPPDPAVTEFQMERVVLAQADGALRLAPSSFACVLLVLEGAGSADTAGAGAGRATLARGKLFLQPAGAVTSVEADAGADLILFRASLKAAF